MADPLTLEELKNVKKGTVLWAVLKRDYAGLKPIKKIRKDAVELAFRTVFVKENPRRILSTTWRNFYTNYWDAYRAWRKMSG